MHDLVFFRLLFRLHYQDQVVFGVLRLSETWSVALV